SRFGRPDELLQNFMQGMEKNPEYRAKVGLTLPTERQEQRWLKSRLQTADDGRLLSAVSRQPSAVALAADRDLDFPAPPAKVPPTKYHIEAKSAPPRYHPINKVSIIRSNQCISCGQCIEACVYGVHDRHPLDVRRMNEPNDYLCRACFRCIQECPRQAL